MMKKHWLSSPFILRLFASCGANDTRDASIENQGRVKKETVSVVPKIAGRILEIKVVEGQAVHKGDTLALLDVPEISSKLQQAEGAISSAQGQLNLALNGATGEQVDQLQGQIDAANAQLQFAEESYQRMSNMFKDSLISAQQFS